MREGSEVNRGCFMVDEIKYVARRRKLLRERAELLEQRLRINKCLRKVDQDMQNWDKVLLNGD